MKCFVRLFCGLALTSTLLACGGSLASNSPFIGTWAGSFSTDTSQTGTLSLVIDAGGAANGTGTNATLGHNFDVSGFIETNGQIDWFKSGGESGGFQGTLSLDGNGHLVGIVVQSTGSASSNTTIDLAPQ